MWQGAKRTLIQGLGLTSKGSSLRTIAKAPILVAAFCRGWFSRSEKLQPRPNGLDNVPMLSKEPKILLFGDQVKAKGLRTVEQLKIFCALEGKALPRNKTLRLPLIKLYRHLPLRQYRTLRFLRRMGPLRTMDATTVPAETIQIIEDEISQFSEAPQAP